MMESSGKTSEFYRRRTEDNPRFTVLGSILVSLL
jgi:hypothetical protein